MSGQSPAPGPGPGPGSRQDDRDDREDDHRERRSDGPERAPDLAVNLVDRPDEVRVELVEERSANVYELEVAEVDLGKVIGRGGKTARALRTVVQAVAPRSRKRTLVEILE